MKKIILLLPLGILLSAAEPIGITGKFGTLGFGLDATFKIKDDFNLRINANKGSLNLDASDSDLIVKGKFDLKSVGLLADYYPTNNKFRLSGGVYYNGNILESESSEVRNNVKIGSNYYDLTKDSKTNIEIETNNIAPYIGIGWGNTVTTLDSWSFNIDVGVLYQGNVKSSLQMSGTAKEHNTGKTINLDTNQVFLNDVKDERNFIDKSTKGIEWYPVISIGVAYSF